MSKYIIKANGNINDVLTALKTLKTVYGESATLSTVAGHRLKIIIDEQLKNIGW